MANWSCICFIFLYYSFPTAVNSLDDEGLSISTLKQSITQNSTNSMANWNLSDPNPCSWKGIQCVENRVVSIGIPNQNLVGSLPPVFSNLSGLRHLNLRNNNFSGPLPFDLFNIKGLQSLVLSGNSFSGSIPSRVGNLGSLRILDLSKNSFVGPIPNNIVRCKRLEVFDLSGNRFSGSVPDGFGDGLTELGTLNLSFNSLSGSIPADFGNLSKLQEPLDLSHNFFNGSIPQSLGNLPERIYIDLSYNNLSGPIPELSTLLDSGPTAFVGNRFLCGLPLKSPCPPNSTPDKDSDPDPDPVPHFPSQESSSGGIFPKHSHNLGKGILIVVITGAMVGSCFIGWVVSHRCKKPINRDNQILRKELFCLKNNDIADVPSSEKMEQHTFVPLDRRVSFDLEKLLKAPAFLLGKSGVGIVYRVVLEDGESLAVRRLGEGGGSQRLKDFQNEVEAIAKIKHPNVVSLRAYCWSEEEKLLVYDFVPNKDLAAAIHGKAGTTPLIPLSWAARLRIMKGIAKGMAYLHEFSPKRYIHGDLKPGNVLLGTNMEPYISDFGLARLATITGESSRLQLEQITVTTPEQTSSPYEFATINSVENIRSYYQSPEAANAAAKPSQKWDVYAFGMILLEMVTGKFPVVEVGQLRFDLPQWIEQRTRLSDVVDPCLVHDLDKEQEMEAVVKMALACLHKSPERRPSMRQILNSFHKLEQIHSN